MKKYLILLLFTSLTWGQFNPIFFASGRCVVVVTDSDAAAFISAAGITNCTQKVAIDNLVISLKSNGLWTKMKAIYPFVGGTAFSHKWNLKDPRDLDAAFRLAYIGTQIHNANGYTTNGIPNDCANSFLNPITDLASLDSAHMSIYSRTDITSTSNADFGCASNTNIRFMMEMRHSDGRIYNDMYGATVNRMSAATANSLGLFVGNRTSSTVANTWRNSTKLTTDSTTRTTSPPSIPMYVGGVNGFGAASNARTYCFATIGDGLTDADVANLYTIIQAYETALGRQI